MFDWTNGSWVPKISDLFNLSDLPNSNWMDMFTYIWVQFLGPYFYGMVVAVIGVALYMKSENPVVAVAYFIIMGVLLGVVMPSIVLFIIGIVSGLIIGILLYQVFVEKGG